MKQSWVTYKIFWFFYYFDTSMFDLIKIFLGVISCEIIGLEPCTCLKVFGIWFTLWNFKYKYS